VTRAAGDWEQWLDQRLDRIRDEGRWRQFRSFDAWGPHGSLDSIDELTGQPTSTKVTSFASNDYLGLSIHPAVIAAAHEALDRWGTGAGGARLITGARPVHQDLERELADWKGMPRAVLFPTGFAANLGTLTALGEAGVHIVSDSLNHASIIDGTRLARADVTIAPHRDLAELERLVAATDQPTLVVSDSVFSMDGDALDIATVADICRRHGALLVLDEAHAVLGPEPTPEELEGVEVVRVGTLSKTLGALGGFVACSDRVADLLINVARPGIFTTALTPADAAAALAALRIVRSAEGDELRATLRRHVDRIRPGHPSPIIALVLGDERVALDAAASLLAQGLWVPAIRPPTVAPGSSRLRITLSAAHTDDDVEQLAAALTGLAPDAP